MRSLLCAALLGMVGSVAGVWYQDYDMVYVNIGGTHPGNGYYPVSGGENTNGNGYKLDIRSGGSVTYWAIWDTSDSVSLRQQCNDANVEGPFSYALGTKCNCNWRSSGGPHVFGVVNGQPAPVVGGGCGAGAATTPVPATDAPTNVPDTVAPASPSPATQAPPTTAPTTPIPATAAPPTVAPSTPFPATPAPETQAPATGAPATPAPVTPAPVTDTPATAAPPTVAPSTPFPGLPVTPAPATQAPATGTPSTPFPATPAPETQAPATGAPATQAPATPAPVTDAPGTAAPPTVVPSTSFPGLPVTPAPATQAPATGAPSTQAPVTPAPVTDAPATAANETAQPHYITLAPGATLAPLKEGQTSSPESGGSDFPWWVLGVVGAVLVVCAAGAFFVYRKSTSTGRFSQQGLLADTEEMDVHGATTTEPASPKVPNTPDADSLLL